MTTRTVVGIQGITAAVAVIALILSAVTLTAKVNQNAKAIQTSALNSCLLLRELILATTLTSAHPVQQTKAVSAYIKTTPLRNCRRYSVLVAP